MLQFKKEAKLFLVFNGNKYLMDTSEIQFGQSYTEESYSKKTLQEEKMFWESSLYKAKPAQWDVNIPLISEQDMRILFDRVIEPKELDLYVETPNKIYKLDNAVATNATFIIARGQPLRLQVTGQAAKLTVETSIEGNPISRASTRTYAKIDVLEVSMGGVSDLTAFNEITAEIQNNIEWIPYDTLNTATVSINKNTVAYPQQYVMKKRIVAGTISRYKVAGETKNPDTTLFIKAGDLDGSRFFGVEFDLDNVSYTSRINTGNVFTESFDWRLTQNPDNLNQLIRYYKEYQTGDVILPSYILDNNLKPILADTGQPLIARV